MGLGLKSEWEKKSEKEKKTEKKKRGFCKKSMESCWKMKNGKKEKGKEWLFSEKPKRKEREK